MLIIHNRTYCDAYHCTQSTFVDVRTSGGNEIEIQVVLNNSMN